jgi:signal transduction histidine kinase
VVKHAATDRCKVTIDAGPQMLSLEITDHGPGPSATGPGSGGHGIDGMRERVAMYGGEFHAGPRPGHGFRVTARFPLAAGPGLAAGTTAGPAGARGTAA